MVNSARLCQFKDCALNHNKHVFMNILDPIRFENVELTFLALSC